MKKKFLVMVLCGIVLVAVATQVAFSSAGAHVVNWGVNPNTQERTPEPPSGGVKLLAEHDGLFVGDGAEKKVYFTFDLGYEAGYTGEVLDILKEHGIKSVFFLCGNYLQERELIDRMLAEGHELGNHTDRHKDLPSLGEDGIKKDIVDFDTKLKEKYPDTTMRFFRPPQGKFCARTLKIAQEQNLRTMMWSIAIVDWGKTPIDAQKSADKIASRLHPGAIILLHITNSGTPQMLRLLLPQMTEKGYSAGQL